MTTAALSLAACGFEIANPALLEEFLTLHSDLAPLITEAKTHLARCFGNEHTLGVEVVTDPETPTDQQSLEVVVHSAGSVEHGMAALDRFDEEWWLDQLLRVKGRVVVTVSFSVDAWLKNVAEDQL